MLKGLQSLPSNSTRDERFTQTLKWIRDLPPSLRSKELLNEFGRVYTIGDAEVVGSVLTTPGVVDDFDPLVPDFGWLRDYVEYTRKTEPPTVFHFFAGAVALGATLGRSSWYDKGAYNVYPNLCVIIVAPTGKCRKTSACNVAVGLVRKVASANVLADKVTPEALVSAFQDQGESVGLIYAPELAVFLGKQKYQEGMVPLLTALFDCPDEWSSATVMRGEVKLQNVAFSMLGCSTMDWLQTAIPKDAFGGGFMSRLLFVVQEDTPKRYAIPPPFDPEMKKRLLQRLLEIQKIKGTWKFTPDATDWYVDWYNRRNDQGTENRQFAGFYERKPDHLIRLAIILGASAGVKDMTLTLRELKAALRILNWMEALLPETFEQMQRNEVGEDHTKVLTILRKNGGQMPYAELLRRCAMWADGAKVKRILDTLREAGLVLRDFANNNTYYLTSEGMK